jgi:hypothetical protein
MFFSTFSNFFYLDFWTFFMNISKINSFWISLFFLFNFIFLLDPSFVFLVVHFFVLSFVI